MHVTYTLCAPTRESCFCAKPENNRSSKEPTKNKSAASQPTNQPGKPPVPLSWSNASRPPPPPRPPAAVRDVQLHSPRITMRISTLNTINTAIHHFQRPSQNALRQPETLTFGGAISLSSFRRSTTERLPDRHPDKTTTTTIPARSSSASGRNQRRREGGGGSWSPNAPTRTKSNRHSLQLVNVIGNKKVQVLSLMHSKRSECLLVDHSNDRTHNSATTAPNE